MAGERTKYNLRLIRQDYTYQTQQVAQMFGICDHTVLRWIKHGLPIIPESRPYLIHSEDLRQFLGKRQTCRKQPCAPNQVYCLKCRKPQQVALGSLNTIPTKNDFIRLTGLCRCCGCTINKIVKPLEWGEKHPLYLCMKPSLKQHNGVQQPPPSCSIEKGGQLCLDLTP